MNLIEENGQLIHNATTDDVLQHYGKKGMKWGVRKVVDYAKAVGRSQYNNIRHPLHSTRAGLEALAKSPFGSKFQTKRSLDYRNNRVAELVSAKANKKAAKKALNAEGPNKWDKKIDKWDSKGGPKNKEERKEYGKLEDKSISYWANKRKNINKNYSETKKNSRVKY